MPGNGTTSSCICAATTSSFRLVVSKVFPLALWSGLASYSFPLHRRSMTTDGARASCSEVTWPASQVAIDLVAISNCYLTGSNCTHVEMRDPKQAHSCYRGSEERCGVQQRAITQMGACLAMSASQLCRTSRRAFSAMRSSSVRFATFLVPRMRPDSFLAACPRIASTSPGVFSAHSG